MFEAKYSFTALGSIGRQDTPRFSLGNGNLRVIAPDEINSLCHGNAVFLAVYAGLIISRNNHRRTSELPELNPVLFLPRSSRLSVFRLHDHYGYIDYTGRTRVCVSRSRADPGEQKLCKRDFRIWHAVAATVAGPFCCAAFRCGALTDAQVALRAGLLIDDVQITTAYRHLRFITVLCARMTASDSAEPELLGGLFLLVGE